MTRVRARYRAAVAVDESAGALVAGRSQIAEPAVRVWGVSKAFVMPRHRAWTLKERLRHPIASFGHDRFEALRDVSLEVAPGEFFAVIGRNGSGKSTLLRCIAGIYELDEGEVRVRGQLAPFIELGVGFQPQLAAEDNVTVAATLMGLRPAEARRRVPRVISFAELEEFVDMPIASYSSGMQVRLAFSTSFQVDAEVLLFDEVLAVGDALFQRKCMETFERLISRGHTIIYVSHNLDTVKRFADRVLLLDRGRALMLGEPEPVIEEYERLNRERERRRRMHLAAPDGYAEVVGAWLETDEGAPVSELGQGEHANFRFVVRLRHDCDRPAMGFALRDGEGRLVLSESDRWRARRRGPARAGELLTFTAPFPSRLAPGAYELAPLLIPPEDEGLVEVPESQLRVTVEPRADGAESEELQLLTAGEGEGARWGAFRRFADVTLTLARTDYKLRYLDSAVGYVWALAQPLLLFAVVYTIWTQVIQVGSDTPHYGLNLLLGLALFTFFTEATAHALPCLVGKGGMLRKIRFPPIALPLASVLNSSFVLGLSLVIVFGFVLASGISPSLAWLELVPLLLLLLAFTAAICMLLSLLYVRVRDVQQIWLVVVRLLFFTTPVFYPIELAPEGLQHILMLNPLAVVIVEARHVLIDPSAPTAASAAGGGGWLAVTSAFSAALVIAGALLYRTRARRLAERV
jgi:ABC-type polysaccharide/polyol phosphate transport system ATPase subunit/ABC-type polysaccharide/polyol phosphate export permease